MSNKLISVDNGGDTGFTNLKGAFSGCSNLISIPNDSSWTKDVTDMSYMLKDATLFNQPINIWDISNVTDMSYMFCGADSFDQPLSDWDTSNVDNMTNMFCANSILSTSNYDSILNSWSSLPVKNNIRLDVGLVQYSSAASAAHYNLTNTYYWIISDGGLYIPFQLLYTYTLDNPRSYTEEPVIVQSLGTLPVLAAWSGISWNGTVFCAVANTPNTAATSPDGITWTQRTLPASAEWRCIAWNGTVFCAIAYGSTIAATSPDGITWTQRALPVSAGWSDIAWNGTVFCVLASGSTTVATSPDGITWTQRALPSSLVTKDLSWNGTVFCSVVYNTNNAITSPDGITWTQRTIPVSAKWRGLAWNGTVFCAVASQSTIAATSPDGITWTQRTLPASAEWRCIAWNGTVFCAVAQLSTIAATSIDGITWTQQVTPLGTYWVKMIWGNNVFCVIGDPTTYVMTTPDGTFVDYEKTALVSTLTELPAYAYWWDIIWNGSIFCVIGESTYACTSPDGITWTKQTLPKYAGYRAVAWNGSLFCIVAYGSTVSATSPDGVTWTEQVMPYGSWHSITSNGSIFCATSGYTSQPQAATSPDGVTWTVRAMPALGKWKRVIWNGSIFCAISETSGHVATSPDGITWTLGAMPHTGLWRGLAWNGSIFCATALYNQTATSVDGLNWVVSVGAPVFEWSDVAWNGTVFCAIDEYYDHFMTSPDGINWTLGDMPISSGDWGSIAWNGSVFCTIGPYNDNAATSPDGTFVDYGVPVMDFPDTTDHRFGSAVDISNNYAIVGAWSMPDTGGVYSGKAYIFDNSTGALLWTLDNPNAYGTTAGDRFGSYVGISDTYSIVGAYNEDDVGGSDSGKAYIFLNSTGELLHTLDNPNAYGTSTSDWFGNSVGISETYCIVGARQEGDAGGAYSGKSYIFLNSTGELLHTLDDPNAYGSSAEDQFGFYVAISESYAIASANCESDVDGTYSGKSYIFNPATGELLHTLNNPNAYGTSTDDYFGDSVSISETYCIIGADGEDDADGEYSGKAYIFLNSTGELLHTLDNPNAYGTSAGDWFGWSVGISEKYSIVGTDYEDDISGLNSGIAYIFDNITGELLHTIYNTNDYGVSANDYFGGSVAITDIHVIVGAWNEDDESGLGSGKAYIYKME